MIPVLQFTNSRVRGGAEDHILMLLQGLDRRRFRLHFVCPPELAGEVSADVPPDVELIPLDLSKPTQLGAIVRFTGALRRRRVEILHSHMFTSSACASPLGWLCRVPVIIETAHGREAWRRGWKARCYVDRIVGRFVDHFIAVSTANARYLVKTKRYAPQKITVIQPGCDLDRFAALHRPTAELRESAGLAAGDRILLAIGRLEPQKGHRVLLEAMPAIVEDCPKARLVCAGDGALRRTLEEQARALGIAHAVRFVGYRRDVRDWLAAAEVSVLSSFYEGLPLAPMQSLAAGCAVVATAVDGTPEVVVDGETGLTVPPGDSGALAAAVCRLLRDKELRGRLTSAGRERVLRRFSREQMVRQTEELYDSLRSRLLQ